MKIDISKYNLEDFRILETNIAGEKCYLINPNHINTKWTKENLIFRSSMWNSNWEPISLSFKKFFNWEEQTEMIPKPNSLKEAKCIEKIDGSTLIVSKYKGELIIRTRGTTSAYNLENGNEIDFLKQKYPNCFNFTNENQTYIYEWVSPVNKIVINYGDDPDIYLTAVINHSDYSMVKQSDLDKIALTLGVKRPKVFSFKSIDDMVYLIDNLKGQEGICVYFKNEQEIKKVKSAWYLTLHRMKTELGSFERVVDLYFVINKPDYNTYYQYVVDNFDYELAESCKSHISRICDGMKEVNKIVKAMKEKADEVRGLTRKEAAAIILSDYGVTNRSGMVFSLLDNKPLQDKDYKRLLFQVTKM
jgi:hypothetical protein